MEISVYQISYFTSFLAFIGLMTLLLINWRKSRYVVGLSMAAIASALWSLSYALQNIISFQDWVPNSIELIRLLAWLIFLSTVHGISQNRSALVGRTSFYTFLAIAGILVLTTQSTAINLDPDSRVLVTSIIFIGLCVSGLLLLENLYRNSNLDSRWAVKFLCFGLGAIFAYDFFYYADAVLFKGMKAVLFEARGFVNSLAVPLIAIAVTRSQSWGIPLHVSRNVAFHTAALIACGIYLLLMAGAGYYVQIFGGDWGATLQITFIASAVLLLFVLFSSGTLRAKTRLFISRNFYTAKYDYRAEWLRFIKTISQQNTSANLQYRIIEAITQVIDSRTGAIYEYDETTQKFVPGASWNFGDDLPSVAAESQFVEIIRQCDDILILEENATALELKKTEFVDWLQEEKRTWFVLPLHHSGLLSAFMLVGQARTRRSLTIEDRELLATLASQAASYLAEERSTNALGDARQFEDFNKRVAFIVHDIKNIINQLALMVKNSETHGHKPEFQKDMLETVDSSVARMTNLLNQLRSKQEVESSQLEEVNLGPYLRDLGQEWMRKHGSIELSIDEQDSRVIGDSSKLQSAIFHLLQNAEDAAGTEGRIALKSSVNGSQALIEVSDNGPGMEESFVRSHLFKPMSSTKPSGFGIGVYQVREYIREMGGELKVSTTLGQGTTMHIALPLSETQTGPGNMT